MRTENTSWLARLFSQKGEPWPVQSEPSEAGLVLLEQLRWDFRSGSSVGQVTREGHRERAQGHHVHHLAHLQTMWNFLWDWKMPDVAHLESVASRFPGPILVFNMQWVLRTV